VLHGRAEALRDPPLADRPGPQIPRPDGYFLQHDEIRVQGWDESCRRSGKTPANCCRERHKCVQLVRRGRPRQTVYVWSDMFDRFHNAQKFGRYYLVKGTGPLVRLLERPR